MLNATWVKPIVRMKVSFEDMVGNELVGPKFHSLITTKQAAPKKDLDEQVDDNRAADETNAQTKRRTR